MMDAQTKKSLTRETLKIYWEHAKKYPWQLLILLLTPFGFAFLPLLRPLVYKKFVDLLTLGQTGEIHQLLKYLFWMAGLTFLGWLCRSVYSFLYDKFTPKVTAEITNESFNKLLEHSHNFFISNFSGGLTKKVFGFSRVFASVLKQFTTEIGYTALNFVIILTILAFQKPIIAVFLVFWGILYLFIQFRIIKYKIPFNKARREAETKVSGEISDAVQHHQSVLLFGNKTFEKERIAKSTEEHSNITTKVWFIGTSISRVQGFLSIALETGVMLILLKMWQKGQATVGDFVLVQSYLMQIFSSLWGIGDHIQRLDREISDANEMTEIFLKEPEIQDAPNAKPLKVQQGQIEFKNVSFRYGDFTTPNASLSVKNPKSLSLEDPTRAIEDGTAKSDLQRQILDNFSLSVAPKEKVALVGSSGGGKSTITKLLFRLYDLQGGSIKIDGQDVRKVTQESLRSSMSLVPQEPVLFHRSVLENIRYGKPDASLEEVVVSARLAHAHEFIEKFPNGYDTLVGERGVKLSGGERQRIAIARAILKNAPILVLDEATSSLDSESESLIQDALRKLMKDKTVIVIAHRLSTIMQMDRIVVIDGGVIVEQGRHEELLKAKQGIYQKLWGIQAGGFDK